MGYPWSDGFSLISNDLNPAIDNTTIKVWHPTTGYTVLGSTQGTDNAVIGTSWQPLNFGSMKITGIPTTTSWSLNFYFGIGHHEPAVGTSSFKLYWNGTHWDTTLGSTHTTSADLPVFVNEDIHLVGVGTVQLYGSSSASTGSAMCRDFRWRIKDRPYVAPPNALGNQ